MDLMDLPNELLVKILLPLSLKDINHLKLVSRKFYLTIQEVYFKLDILSVLDLDIKSYLDEFGKEKFDIRLFFEYTKNIPFRDGKFEEKNITLDDVHNYFKWLKFANLMQLRITASKVTGIFKLTNNYIKHNRLKLSYLEISIKGCPVIESFTEFLTYIDDTYNLKLSRICFYPMKLEELRIPHFKSLKSLTVENCLSSTFMKKEYISMIFVYNIKLNYLALSTMNNIFDKNIIDNLFETLCNISENDCSRHYIKIRMVINDATKFLNKAINLEKNKNYVIKGKLDYDRIAGYLFYLLNKSDCPVCFESRSIGLQLLTSTEKSNCCYY